MCQPEDEIQFNHKPAEMLLTEKRRASAKMAKPKYNWDLLIFYTRYAITGVKSSTAPSRADPRGGLSSLPMVPTTTNLTDPPTPISS